MSRGHHHGDLALAVALAWLLALVVLGIAAEAVLDALTGAAGVPVEARP